ncbi:MAG: DinB family protein [Phototrophicaceae bacterium]
MTNDTVMRQELVNLLMLRQAHMIFEDAVQDFPVDAYNVKPAPLTYSYWHLLEHIRICQVDILDYITDSDYVAPDFPAGYWRSEDTTCTPQDWQQTIQQFYDDRQALVDIVMHPNTDLQAQIPHAQAGHTIAREIIIVGQHNAYHIGEFGILRQLHGLW